MAEVLLEFEDWFEGPDGKNYQPRVCGRMREDGTWEGWIEFVAADGGVVPTGQETTQPNRDQLHYWATGLTAGYLDGALLRTLKPPRTLRPRTITHPQPAFDRPAPHIQHVHEPTTLSSTAAVRPVLDPFAVYAEGDHVLHGQLEALNEGQLRTIIRGYGLGADRWGEIEAMNRYDLAHHILGEVKRRAGP